MDAAQDSSAGIPDCPEAELIARTRGGEQRSRARASENVVGLRPPGVYHPTL